MSVYSPLAGIWIEDPSNFGRFIGSILDSNDPVFDLVGFEAHDSNVTASLLSTARVFKNREGRNLRCTLVFDPSWWKDGAGKLPDPLAAAALLDHFVGVSRPEHVLIDGEMHDAKWMQAFLWGEVRDGVERRGVRGIGGRRACVGGLRPGIAIDWTLESFQDGNWWTLPAGESIYQDFTIARIDPVIQPYGGRMQRFGERAAIDYAVKYGTPFSRVRTFVDGEAMRTRELQDVVTGQRFTRERMTMIGKSTWVFTAERWLG